MSTQKAKFALFSRLQDMGFTYDEAARLRRIEMTLQRWGEMECGDDNGRCIERDGVTGRAYMTYDVGQSGKRGRYAIADCTLITPRRFPPRGKKIKHHECKN